MIRINTHYETNESASGKQVCVPKRRGWAEKTFTNYNTLIFISRPLYALQDVWNLQLHQVVRIQTGNNTKPALLGPNDHQVQAT